MEQGVISLPYWEVSDFVPIVLCWVTLGTLSWLVGRLPALKMSRRTRRSLAATSGVLAAVIGVPSVLLIALELAQGQAHGPSPLWIGLFCLPFAIFWAASWRWLRGRDPGPPEPRDSRALRSPDP